MLLGEGFSERANNPLRSQRQLGAANTESILQRVGDGGRDGDTSRLTHALCAERAVRRWNLDQVYRKLRDVWRRWEQVFPQVGVQVRPILGDQLLGQGITEPKHDPAFDLALAVQWVERLPNVLRREVLQDVDQPRLR